MDDAGRSDDLAGGSLWTQAMSAEEHHEDEVFVFMMFVVPGDVRSRPGPTQRQCERTLTSGKLSG